MAFIHGKDTVVTVNSADLSAFCRSSELDLSLDTHDVTAYGASAHAYRGGLKDGTFSLEGTYDDGAAGPEATLAPLLNDLDGFTVVFRPEGAGSGLAQRSFTALLSSYSESDPVDDMITWSAEFQITGPVDFTAQS